MPFGSLSNVLELKHAEGFRGSSVLQQSYPLTGYTTAAAAPAAFTPLSLFASGEQGAWYDPSNLATMFEDTAGTTPVHTPGNGTADSPVGKILDKSGRGNHATQSTGTARPTLSALYNIARYTEQFDNAFWTTGGSNASIVANQTTAPDGTSTADFLKEAATTFNHCVYNNASIAALAANYTCSFAAKASTRNYCAVCFVDAAGNRYGAVFDLVNGTVTATQSSGSPTGTGNSITALGNGWYRCSVTCTSGAGGVYAQIGISNVASPVTWQYNMPSYAGDGSSGIYIWGADLRVSNDGVGLPAYQRVVDASTYDSTGFPYYLYANGTQYLRCASVDMTASNKAALFTAIRVLRDTDTQLIHDFNQSVSGQFVFYYKNPTKGTTLYYGGTVANNLESVPSGGLSSPVGKVFTATVDISAPLGLIRQNGTQLTSSTTSVGTGNFGNGILDLFARGSGLTIQARMYGHIFRGTLSSSTDITNTETWLNGKAKLY